MTSIWRDDCDECDKEAICLVMGCDDYNVYICKSCMLEKIKEIDEYKG